MENAHESEAKLETEQGELENILDYSALPCHEGDSIASGALMLVVKRVSIPRHSDFAAIAGQANDNM